MTISQKIDSYVRHQQFGKVFTIKQLASRTKLENKKNTVTTVLKRMADKQEIIKLSSGVYYRPKHSRFGPLPVDVDNLIVSISRDKKAAYVVAGAAAMNSLGLSTQLPMTRSYIISARIRSEFKSTNIKLKYSKAFAHFDDNLRIQDKNQRQYALLIWSALNYIGRSKAEKFRSQLIDRFHKSLSAPAQTSFLNALPASMAWVKDELGEEIS